MISAGSLTPLKLQIVVLGPQLFFKGNIPQTTVNSHGNIPIPRLNFKQKQGILGFNFNDPAETDFDDFRSDYLDEYEAICEGRKSRATVPLGADFKMKVNFPAAVLRKRSRCLFINRKL
jgi:hypothetical protein